MQSNNFPGEAKLGTTMMTSFFNFFILWNCFVFVDPFCLQTISGMLAPLVVENESIESFDRNNTFHWSKVERLKTFNFRFDYSELFSSTKEWDMKK